MGTGHHAAISAGNSRGDKDSYGLDFKSEIRATDSPPIIGARHSGPQRVNEGKSVGLGGLSPCKSQPHQ